VGICSEWIPTCSFILLDEWEDLLNSFSTGFPRRFGALFEMVEAKLNVNAASIRRNQLTAGIIILILLVLAGLYASGVMRPQTVSPEFVSISEGELEKQYGLKVLLVAVTGAGGFVDLRITIVDGEKAKTLLSDPGNFPAVWVRDGVLLDAPEDTKSQKIRYDDGGTMFVLYPNAGNAVKHGEPVRILFGRILLEPMDAK